MFSFFRRVVFMIEQLFAKVRGSDKPAAGWTVLSRRRSRISGGPNPGGLSAPDTENVSGHL